jgi:ABC-type multidrug transport system ATPase subunit
MIHARKLLVDLGGRRILDGVDLEVARGQAVALVGPNGAGKTSVIRCLLGLIAYGGELTLAGVDPRVDPVRARQWLGYMPQVPAFCEERADHALQFVAALRGAPRSEVAARLQQVGLWPHARRRVQSFSTGMKQRLSLAAALIGDPPLLVLDEPTASLDLGGQADIVRMLRRLRASGRTIVLSSHRPEEVRALADRVVVLDGGRVVAQGPADRIATAVWGAPAAGGPAPAACAGLVESGGAPVELAGCAALVGEP